MNRMLALLVVCALAPGCVGIGVRTTKTKSIQRPLLADANSQTGLWSRATKDSNGPPLTSAWLESHCGKPTAVSPAPGGDAGELWTYDSGLNWNGVILFVLIPIPLEVPLGREWSRFLVRDGQVISGECRSTHATGGIIGYSIGPCGPTGFGVHSLDDGDKP